MGKKSISQVVQLTALAFGTTALVLSVACAPRKDRSVPVTKAAIDVYNAKVADSAKRIFPTFQCTTADTVDLSSRVQGATVEVTPQELVDPSIPGNFKFYQVALRISVLDHDTKSSYQFQAQQTVGNDGKAVVLGIAPTEYANHPEAHYIFEAACVMVKNQCKTVLVHVVEKNSAAADVAVASDDKPADKPTDKPAPSDVTEESEALSAPVVKVPVAAQGAATRETVLGFHLGVSPAPSPSPAPAPALSQAAPAIQSVTMPMAWKPGASSAKGQCSAGETNSFERAAQGLPPASPFAKPAATATPDNSDRTQPAPVAPPAQASAPIAADGIADSAPEVGSRVEAPPVPNAPVEQSESAPASAPIQDNGQDLTK